MTFPRPGLLLFWESNRRVIGFNGIPFSLDEAIDLRRAYLGHSIRSDLDQAARDFCRRCARELTSAIRAVSAKGCD